MPKAWRSGASDPFPAVSGGSVVDQPHLRRPGRLRCAPPIVERLEKTAFQQGMAADRGTVQRTRTADGTDAEAFGQVRKKGADSFSQVAPLFNQLFEQEQNCKNWNRFKQTDVQAAMETLSGRTGKAEKKNKSRQSSSKIRMSRTAQTSTDVSA